jgi:hypothetical protein
LHYLDHFLALTDIWGKYETEMEAFSEDEVTLGRCEVEHSRYKESAESRRRDRWTSWWRPGGKLDQKAVVRHFGEVHHWRLASPGPMRWKLIGEESMNTGTIKTSLSQGSPWIVNQTIVTGGGNVPAASWLIDAYRITYPNIYGVRGWP